MPDLSSAVPSRRTVLSAAALLGGAAVVAGGTRHSPAAAVETASSTVTTGYSGVIAVLDSLPTYFEKPSPYSSGTTWITPVAVAVDPATNIAYAGTGNQDHQGLFSTDLNAGPFEGHSVSTAAAAVGAVTGMAVGGSTLYFGTAGNCEILAHHMPSGVVEPTSFRGLGDLAPTHRQVTTTAWSATAAHVVFGTRPVDTTEELGTGVVGAIDTATGKMTVHPGPVPGHQINALAGSGDTVFGVTRFVAHNYVTTDEYMNGTPPMPMLGSDRVFAMNALTGQVLWLAALPDYEDMHDILFHEGKLYAARRDAVVEIDPTTGDVLHTVAVEAPDTDYWNNPEDIALHTEPGTHRMLHVRESQVTLISLRSGRTGVASTVLRPLMFTDTAGKLWATDGGVSFQQMTMHNEGDPGLPFAGPLTSPFADVATGHVFYDEISWLSEVGVSGGWSTARGKEFRPTAKVTREIMAAFLYRLAGSPDCTAPATSPFADVATTAAFYQHMAWLAASGISTGWSGPNGTRLYRPESDVLRDQMAAFMYRLAGEPEYTPPAVSPFADVPTSHVFYTPIAWLAGQGISGGWSTSRGKEFRPYGPVLRDQMAAFMYRLAATAL